MSLLFEQMLLVRMVIRNAPAGVVLSKNGAVNAKLEEIDKALEKILWHEKRLVPELVLNRAMYFGITKRTRRSVRHVRFAEVEILREQVVDVALTTQVGP